MLAFLASLAAAGPRYTVSVEPVYEVCLVGEADPAWAEAVLAPEGLAPALTDGKARLQVCGTAARFAGRAFREGIVALDVAAPGDAAFLVVAVNDRKFFAWVERTRNRSPYLHGHVGEPDGVHLSIGTTAETALVATRAGGALPSAEQAVFEGPIHLPRGHLFHARLEGPLATAPFEGPDTLTLPARGADPLVDVLHDAAFVPTAWRVGAERRHAKTRTTSRSAAAAAG